MSTESKPTPLNDEGIINTMILSQLSAVVINDPGFGAVTCIQLSPEACNAMRETYVGGPGAELLKGYRKLIAEMMRGNWNITTARAKIQDLLDALEYNAENGGFPGLPVEPAEHGTLQDLASNDRVDLVLRTVTAQVAGIAETERAMGDDALYWYPAWELVRVATVVIPRGKKLGKCGELEDDPGQSWPDRWAKCGGQFYSGRMIARKDNPIWNEIGNSANFPDALDTSYPPYAFGSGMGRREVPRRDCVEIELITAADEVSPLAVRMNEALQASVKNISTEELKAIRDGLQKEIEESEIKLKAIGYDLKTRRYVR